MIKRIIVREDFNPYHEISHDDFVKCKNFAIASVSTSKDKYAERGQTDIDKIKEDILQGKIAELNVYYSLLSTFPNITPPDFNTYSKENKNWNADLKSGINRFSVKSINNNMCKFFCESYVFETTDTALSTKDVNYYACFVYVNLDEKRSIIRSIIPMVELINNNLFRPMIKKALNTKKAVYMKDLEVIYGKV